MFHVHSNRFWALAFALAVSTLAACGGAPTIVDDSEPAASASEPLQVAAPLAEGPQAPAEADAAAASGTLFLVGSIKDSAGAAVPGVAVKLTGAATRTSNANSDGIYRFSNLAAGTYVVTAVKSGAVFAPVSSTFALSADSEHSFLCESGCDGAATVAPLKELTIVDPSVTNDTRASNAADGHWSFRFMMEQMTPPGVDPADFVLNWIQGFKASAGPINGFPVSDRSVDTGLVGVWPKRSDGKLDLSAAPFKLLAIVNRSDLHSVGDGEGRFIYGMTLNGFGQSFTVIFEFGLPTVNAATQAAITRQNWITQFHALGVVPFGSTFNSDLQAITDQFVTAGKVPSKPNGSAINQVRTNEIQFGGPWQLREFHLVKGATGLGALTLAPAAQTPDDSLNNSASLANFLQTNRFRVIGGIAPLNSTMVGGQSNEVSAPQTWSFPSFPAIDEETRHAFSGQTCNGCHNAETKQIDGFYQVSPRVAPGPDGSGSISDFIKNNEFPRRRRFMQNRLVCKPDFSDCSPGAEPMP